MLRNCAKEKGAYAIRLFACDRTRMPENPEEDDEEEDKRGGTEEESIVPRPIEDPG